MRPSGTLSSLIAALILLSWAALAVIIGFGDRGAGGFVGAAMLSAAADQADQQEQTDAAVPAADPAAEPAVEADAGVALDRAAIRDEVRRLLLDEPELVADALRELDRRQMQAAMDDLDASVEDGEYVRVSEVDAADLTLIELTDYDCPYCKRSQPEIQEFLSRDGRVNHVVKMLPYIGTELPERAALAAKMQAEPEVLSQLHAALMSHEGRLTPDAVELIAVDLGLDWSRMLQDMNSDVVENQIGRTMSNARALRINGTPAFIIGGQVFSGLQPADQMLAIAEQLRTERAAN